MSDEAAIARQQALIGWYRLQRRELPWRHDGPGGHPDPYVVLVSESMLQQTRVEAVLEPFARWMQRFPSFAALAAADEADVVASWAGLGYYRRARNLHAAARAVVALHGGVLPADPAAIAALPGVGPYTTGALRSIGLGLPAALVDGNVARVLARLALVRARVDQPAGMRQIWALAEQAFAIDGPARADPSRYNQALMELGATLCRVGAPRCDACPVARWCEGLAAGAAAELPRKGSKRPPSDVHAAAFVALRSGAAGVEVLMGRRALGSRWGGLWQPAMVEAADAGAAFAALRAALAEVEALAPDAVGPELAQLEHVLTHRRYRVDAMVVRVPEGAGRGAVVAALERATRVLGFADPAWRAVADVSGRGDGVSRLGQRLVAAVA